MSVQRSHNALKSRRQTGRALAIRQSGVALAIVVWFIAGMSLLVAGVVLSARTDVRLAQLHIGRAQASAVGDGAIRLLLADLVDGQFAAANGGGRPLAQQQYQLGEHRVAVLATPVSRLVDINSASEELLAETMLRAGSVVADDARLLSSAVVQWRQTDRSSRAGRFEALEDLLSVEGMNRANWDGMRDYIAVAQGRGGLARLSAQARTALDALEQIRPAARAQSATRLAPPGIGEQLGGGAGDLRVDALVELGGRLWLRRRWISLSGSTGSLPWREQRTEPARIVRQDRLQGQGRQ